MTDKYDEGCLRELERKVEEIHGEALRRAQAADPRVTFVVDNRSLYDYSERFYDYPGQWYLYFRLPAGYESEIELINDIVLKTLRYFSEK